MSAVALDIADAVVAAVNAHPFAGPYAALAAARQWVVPTKLEDLDTLKVSVVPLAFAGTPLTRGLSEDTSIDIGLGFQRRLPQPFADDDLEALVQLVQDVRDYLVKSAGRMAGARCLRGQIAPLYDGPLLDSAGQFLSLVTLTYWLVR